MSLVSAYEDAVDLVRRYEAYSARFAARRMTTLAVQRGSIPLSDLRSPFSRPGGLADAYRRVASPTDVQDPLFGFMVCEQPYEALAATFIQEHPDLVASDTAAMLEIHRLHVTRHRSASWQTWLAAVLAITAFVAQYFNAEVFDFMGWSGYAAYRTGLAFCTIGVLLFVAAMMAAMSSAFRKTNPVQNVEIMLLLAQARLQRAPGDSLRP